VNLGPDNYAVTLLAIWIRVLSAFRPK